MAREDGKSSIDFTELARLLAQQKTVSAPTPVPAKDKLTNFVANADTRQKELDALLAQANANIAAAGGTPKPQPFTQPMTIAGQVTTPAAPKNISQMTQEEIDAFTKATISKGGKSTDAANRLPGESASAANIRITEGYKNFLAKPVLSQEAKDAGVTVQFVRVGSGGQGEYTAILPVGYSGPPVVTNKWTDGIIPATGKYTTGSSAGATVSNGKIVSSPTGVKPPNGTTPVPSNTAPNPSGITPPPSDTVPNPTGITEDGNKTPSVGATLISTETDAYGNVIGVYSDGTTKTLISSGNQYKSTVDLDAYALLEETFKAYGLETLVPKIKTYMERGLGSNQAALQLKTEPEYVERFRGNEIRRATGLNVLSEGEYLALEDAYSQTLRAYGLQNYFGIDRKAKTASMADIIGNDIDATEFKDRIDTVVTRVQNADPAIKRTLVSFYNINDTDLIKYFLDPKANLPKLQEKVTAAEIGSAALGQGLATNVNDATALALFGITRGQALEGYAKIGERLPTAKKLSGIYAEEEIDYTQTTAEEEVFKGLASAERKRRQLAAREVASFGGASGVSKSAFGSATGGAF